MLKEIKRAVHFDFHTMPGIDNFGENFDAAKFAEQMEKANVAYVNMFARCNIGFSYYPTKIGVRYPGLKTDMLGDVVRECHKRNIGVAGYLNTSINHEIALRHPEWIILRINGKSYDFETGGANGFRSLCYNSGYGDYFIEEVKEVLSEGVDGIFCDCYRAVPCRCAKCTELMLKEGFDPTDDDAVVRFSEISKDRFMNRIRKAVPEDKRLVISVVGPWKGNGINSHYEIECLPSQWGYDYFPPYVAFARTLYDTVVYMNGRFQICWGDFGGYKGKASIENDFYDAIMNGAVPMLGDHLHPSELPENDVYRDVGELYGKIKEYEKWTDGTKFVAEIAILTDQNFLNQSLYGAARMLSELKYTYDIVYTECDFSKYGLVIIPDSIRFDEKLAKKISKYLEDGGRVISSGTSALTKNELKFALPEWSFEPVAYIENDGAELISHGYAGFTTYFTLNYPSSLARIRYSEYETAISMKAGAANTSLADEYRSYFDKSGWDGRHYIFYTPPKESTGNSVIALNSQENVAHIAFPMFLAYRESSSAVYRDILKVLLKRLMPENLIRTDDMPSSSRITLTGNGDYKLLHVKVTYPEIKGRMGIVGEHTELIAGKTVAVRGEYREAYRLPDMASVKSEIKDGYTYITLPQIIGYDMFLLK